MKNIALLSKLLLAFLLIYGCTEDDSLNNQNEKSNTTSTSAKNANITEVTIVLDPNSLNDINSEIQENTTIKFDVMPGKSYNMAPIIIGDCNASTPFSNFHIEGNGAIINFPHNGVGIEVCNASDITLKKFTITNFSSTPNITFSHSIPMKGRIHVFQSNKVTADSLNIKKQWAPGKPAPRYFQIALEESKFCTVSNSTFQSATGELIALIASEDCEIFGNKTYGGASGISTEGKQDNNGNDLNGFRNKIFDNEVFDAGAAFITVNDHETEVIHNHIEVKDPNGIGGPGIRFGHNVEKDILGNIIKEYTYARAVNCVARGNTILNMKKQLHNEDGEPVDFSIPVGIKVDATNESGVIIEKNIIEDCNVGIQVSNQENQRATIIDNGIDVFGKGIFLYNADKNKNIRIEENQITSKNIGIEMNLSSAKITNENIIDVTNKGILIQNAQSSNIKNTTIVSKNIGIHLLNSTSPTLFEGNTITSKNQSIALFNVKNATIRNNDSLISDNTVIQLYNSVASIDRNFIKSTSTEYNPAVAGIIIQNTEANRTYPSDGSGNISLTHNVIELNGAYGIFNNEDTRLKNTLIAYNEINNGHIGIYFGGENTHILDNDITHSSTVNSQYSKPIYLRYGAKDPIVAINRIKSDITSAVYLESTINADIFSNTFEFTGSGKLGYAVWQSGYNSGIDVDNNNILINYNNQTNK